jgi:hypothetical protein
MKPSITFDGPIKPTRNYSIGSDGALRPRLGAVLTDSGRLGSHPNRCFRPSRTLPLQYCIVLPPLSIFFFRLGDPFGRDCTVLAAPTAQPPEVP